MLALLSANYQIPIFWLSLFTADDIISEQVELMDRNDQLTIETVPALRTPVSMGLDVCMRRSTIILSMVPQPLSLHYDEWRSFIRGLTRHFGYVNLSEIWCMFDVGEFEPYLRSLLHCFETKDPAVWHDLLEQANIGLPGPEQTYDANAAKYGLRG